MATPFVSASVQELRLGSEEVSLVSTFHNVTGATVKDCIVDEKLDRVIFVIAKGQMGLAIGKDGASLRKVRAALDKDVDVAEWPENVDQLIISALGTKHIEQIEMKPRADGSQLLVITVTPKKVGAVVGVKGNRAEKIRLMARRYFNITHVKIMETDGVRAGAIQDDV